MRFAWFQLLFDRFNESHTCTQYIHHQHMRTHWCMDDVPFITKCASYIIIIGIYGHIIDFYWSIDVSNRYHRDIAWNKCNPECKPFRQPGEIELIAVCLTLKATATHRNRVFMATYYYRHIEKWILFHRCPYQIFGISQQHATMKYAVPDVCGSALFCEPQRNEKLMYTPGLLIYLCILKTDHDMCVCVSSRVKDCSRYF